MCQLEGSFEMNEWTERENPANTKSGSFIIRKVMSLPNFSEWMNEAMNEREKNPANLAPKADARQT